MSTISAMNQFEQYPHVRLVATTNQTGTYFNGPTNNGVGATFTYSAGALTIDSVNVNLNDYVLFSGQSSGYQNGIYQCIQAGSAGAAAILQRRGDFQTREQIRGGHYVPVSAGTINAGSFWAVTEPLPAAIGQPADNGSGNNIVIVNVGSDSIPLDNVLTYSGSISPNHLLTVLTSNGVMHDSGLNFNTAFPSNGDAVNTYVPLATDTVGNLTFINQLPRFASGVISLSQIQNLYTTPIELIPSVLGNNVWVISQLFLEFVYGGTLFTGGGNIYLQYGATGHGTNYASPATAIPASFLTGATTSSKVISTTGLINGTSGLSNNVTNNAQITITNDTAVFAGGTGGFLNWYIWYQLVPVNL